METQFEIEAQGTIVENIDQYLLNNWVIENHDKIKNNDMSIWPEEILTEVYRFAGDTAKSFRIPHNFYEDYVQEFVCLFVSTVCKKYNPIANVKVTTYARTAFWRHYVRTSQAWNSRFISLDVDTSNFAQEPMLSTVKSNEKNAHETYIEKTYAKFLREKLSNYPLIEKHFFQNKPIAVIAQEENRSRQSIQQLIDKEKKNLLLDIKNSGIDVPYVGEDAYNKTFELLNKIFQTNPTRKYLNQNRHEKYLQMLAHYTEINGQIPVLVRGLNLQNKDQKWFWAQTRSIKLFLNGKRYTYPQDFVDNINKINPNALLSKKKYIELKNQATIEK